jgi:hypothetical protein
MRPYITLCLLCLTFSSLQAEEASPLTMPLTAGNETLVTCFVKGGKKLKSRGGKGTSEDTTKADWKKAYHYKLYIPENYDEDKEKRYPCMFIASSAGHANMGKMAKRLKDNNWVVVMLIESKNGTPDWLANFIAAHDDVIQRVRICNDFKVATGMSGGARCASEYPLYRKGFRGVILQAAGFFSSYQYEKYPAKTAVATTFGNKDGNLYESQKSRRILNPKTPRYIDVFEGGHNWAPEETFNRALDWIEENAFIKVKKRASKQQKPAFVWLLDQKLRHLETAESDVEKYHLIQQILALATNGGLTFDKTYSTQLVELQKQRLVLKKKPLVYKEILAEIAFKKTQKKVNSFNRQMRRARHVPRKFIMSNTDIKALLSMKRELEKFAKKYPDTRRGKAVQLGLTSLRYEYQKIDKKGK